MITASIIKDSINVCGRRITTFILNYPRFIHAELLTHRMFSRNSSSSRAIPITKMIEDVLTNPAQPIHWGKNQKGMQAYEEISKEESIKAKLIWFESRDLMIEQVKKLTEIGLHKQICNRLLEPFANIKVLLTATEFTNFFNLRAHNAAQPEIKELAYEMLENYETSTPTLLELNEWHIPFSDKMPDVDNDTKLAIAVARAARVSYNSFEGVIDTNKDVELFKKLYEEKHFSPFEHCAVNKNDDNRYDNFIGWASYRNILSNR